MKIVVFGAGAWGTAMAASAALHPGGHEVTLWARNAQQAAVMRSSGVNQRYLPDIALPPALRIVSGDWQAPLAGADLVILGTPMASLRAWLELLRDCPAPLAWLCKGFEPPAQGLTDGSAGLLPHEVQQQVAPALMAVALSGPSFAQEVARGQPTALVAASRHAGVRQTLVEALHGPSLRV